MSPGAEYARIGGNGPDGSSGFFKKHPRIKYAAVGAFVLSATGVAVYGNFAGWYHSNKNNAQAAKPTTGPTPTSSVSATPTPTQSATTSLTPSHTPGGHSPSAPVSSHSPTSTATQTSTPSVTSTPSKTPTGTATQTSTPSVTSTPSKTPTGTATQTSTPSVTSTPSKTPTGTATQTSTPSVTSTSSSTPTGTATQTSTASVTSTPSSTSTSTATRTSTPSITSTPSSTSTSTATRTSTPSITSTSSSTSTGTPTQTSTSSITPSETSTSTATPTSTPSCTPTPTNTATPTVTSSSVSTPSQTLTPSATPHCSPGSIAGWIDHSEAGVYANVNTVVALGDGQYQPCSPDAMMSLVTLFTDPSHLEIASGCHAFEYNRITKNLAIFAQTNITNAEFVDGVAKCHVKVLSFPHDNKITVLITANFDGGKPVIDQPLRVISDNQSDSALLAVSNGSVSGTVTPILRQLRGGDVNDADIMSTAAKPLQQALINNASILAKSSVAILAVLAIGYVGYKMIASNQQQSIECCAA